ncbi:MAG: nitroreductase family protein [Archaeoglobaceae archaeon]|nr:nitroreductase family protein [Archaeoglobaceae archaeon]MDW8128536.1 nitroreductase family protein [Archaeoglobaceae archaeon]
MENCLKIIYTRRSIRSFTGKEISEEDLNKILRAAFQSPSAGNEQPWHFIVIKSKEKLNELSNAHPYGKMLVKAGAAIAVCCDPRLSKYPNPMWIQDCSAATQNILLSARALGIGSCWLGVYPIQSRMKAIAEVLGVPNEIIVFSLVALGYPHSEEEFFEASDRFKQERIHYERW